MSNLLLCVHVAAAIAIGMDARRRGRSPIVWTLLTLIPYAIFVTWPLLYILPRLTPPPDVRNGAQDEPTVAGQERLGQIGNLRLTTNNRSFYVGVTVWVVCLIVIGIGIVIGKHSPEALANRVQQNSQQFDRARLAAEMLDKVTHRAGRMYDLCSYVGTVAAQFRMEALVPLSTCERIRTGQNDVIARINGIARNGTDEDLRAMSRIVDQFMIESAPQLQTMEESYATVNRIMREAGKK